MVNHKIMELYSGIGGMHCAWQRSGLLGEIAVAIDINTVANEVYKHNFKDTTLLNRNIQSLTSEQVKKLNVDTILMSPPCQPFTRNGKQLDDSDPRTKSFLSLLTILEKLDCIKYILMENVKGFESSSVHDVFIETLKECGFNYQEFLICPSSIGVPNSRLRYYCIARRTESEWKFQRSKEIMSLLPSRYEQPYELDSILEKEISDEYLVPAKLLKRANILDICHRNSRRSCCFTKAYSHYTEGTGSVFTESNLAQVQECYKLANGHNVGSDEFVKCLQPLKLRYFTPNEVLALMEFPKDYSFPANTSNKQCYRLLGNSVNVKVISELLTILYS